MTPLPGLHLTWAEVVERDVGNWRYEQYVKLSSEGKPLVRRFDKDKPSGDWVVLPLDATIATQEFTGWAYCIHGDNITVIVRSGPRVGLVGHVPVAAAMFDVPLTHALSATTTRP